MRDESTGSGRIATRRLDDVARRRSAESRAPVARRARWTAGHVRRQDPLALAHWIARITFTCLLAPPPGDLLAALDALPAAGARPGARRPPRNRRSTTVLDTVIRGGTIVDGTGAAPFTGDVAIRDGRIVAVGTVDGPRREEIDADGALVTPGFLDLHTHYDGQVTWDDAPRAVGHQRHHDHRARQLRRRLRAGAPGRPRVAHRHDGRRRGHPRRRAHRSACRGASGRSFGEYLDVHRRAAATPPTSPATSPTARSGTT